MTSHEPLGIPDISPEMREHTRFLREMEAPESFSFLGNFTIDPFDSTTPPASLHADRLERKYGEGSIFTTERAYSEDGSYCEGALAIYKKDGVEALPVKTRILRKLGFASHH